MNKNDYQEFLDRARKKTLELLDAVAKQPDPQAVLAWRPGPGRAHLAWQLMHLAATDDRHLYVRMGTGGAREPEYVRRFGAGSTPDDEIPPLDEIRRYLDVRRQEIKQFLDQLDPKLLPTKPNEQAPWTYHEWFQILAWHEAHHHGQGHLTLNLFRALNAPEGPKESLK